MSSFDSTYSTCCLYTDAVLRLNQRHALFKQLLIMHSVTGRLFLFGRFRFIASPHLAIGAPT